MIIHSIAQNTGLKLSFVLLGILFAWNVDTRPDVTISHAINLFLSFFNCKLDTIIGYNAICFYMISRNKFE